MSTETKNPSIPTGEEVVKSAPQIPQNKPAEQPTIQQLIDFAKLKAKKITAFQLGSVEVEDENKNMVSKKRFVGQPGHNPYLYIAQNVDPVLDKIEQETITESELKAFLKLPDEVTPDGKVLKKQNVMLREHMRQQSVRDK